MSELILAKELAIICILAFIGGTLAKKAKLPLVLGYIISGVLFNALLGQLLPDKSNLENIAQIGVALLLFSLGLEFSYERLKKLKKLAVSGTFLQIIFTILLTIIFGRLFNFSLYEAVFFGAVSSLSSTAIVVKILADKGELDTQSGTITLDWLLIQDLFVLPLSLLLPSLFLFSNGNFSSSIIEVLKSLGLAILVIYFILLFGRKIIPKILDKIGGLNSRELMLLGAVSMSILFSFIFLQLGLSFALGAFVAGMLVSSSFQNHALFAEIRPLRDLFTMVFFVLLGMFTDLGFVFSHLPIIFGLTLFVIITKYLIVFLLLKWSKHHPRVSHESALDLFQIGEFAFILSLSAVSTKIITSYFYSLIVSVALLTIIITPLIIAKSLAIYLFMEKIIRQFFPPLHRKLFMANITDSLKKEELPFQNHVVLCGYGRVGKHIGDVLLAYGLPFIVVDMNHEVVKKLKLRNIPVVYGDPADLGILDYAQVDKASVVVIAIPDLFSQEQIIVNSLNLNRNITIICRSHVEHDRPHLLGKGANIIVQPEFEASLSISHKILEHYNIPKESIQGSLKSLREWQEKQ